MVFHLLVQDRLLLRVDEAQRDGQPVNGLGTAALDAQHRLLLGLLQHEAVFIGDPGLLGGVSGALCRVVVMRAGVCRSLCRHRRAWGSALGQAIALVAPWGLA